MINIVKKNRHHLFFFHDTNYIDENDQIIDSHLHKYVLPFPEIIKNINKQLKLK